MPTVATVLDATLARIRVDLSGWSPDGPVTVTGSDGVSSWRVRSITAISGGVSTGWDYEAALGVPVTYTATSGATSVSSAPVTLPVSAQMCAWLRAPGLPALDMQIEPVGKPSIKRERASAVLRPMGRRTAVTLSGALSVGSFDLVVRTYTDAQAQALDQLVALSPVALLLMPGTRTARQYVSIAGLDEDPDVHYRAQSAAADDVGRWATWVLPCTVTTQPAGGVFGDPSVSWQAVKSTYATWTATKAAKASWLDVLKGVS